MQFREVLLQHDASMLGLCVCVCVLVGFGEVIQDYKARPNKIKVVN